MLTPERVESALAARADAGLSRASLEKVRGTLSQVLSAENRRSTRFIHDPWVGVKWKWNRR